MFEIGKIQDPYAVDHYHIVNAPDFFYFAVPAFVVVADSAQEVRGRNCRAQGGASSGKGENGRHAVSTLAYTGHRISSVLVCGPALG